MGWPTANEFALAIQHPFRHFCKPELKRGQAVLDEQAMPCVYSGRHLDVYEMRGAGGVDSWAIGCFTQPPKGVARRYRLINEHLQKQPAECLVEQEYLEQGICVRGRWYPITRSRWIDGLPINEYVRQYLDHPDELRLLASAWVRAASEMRRSGIAHGDLQPSTVLVRTGHGGALELRFVDYDGLYVPTLSEPIAASARHADFQHPQSASRRIYNGDMDRFSQLVVLTALYALAVEGRALWQRFDSGENTLFRQSDYEKPGNSALFGVLWQSESSTVRALAGYLILAALGSIDEVPSLEKVTECLRPGAARSALTSVQIEIIKKVMETGVRLNFNLALDEKPVESWSAERDTVSEVAAVAVLDTREAIMVGRASPCVATPPPLPSLTAREHPQTETFQLDAWMPEEVAVVKLHGFVRDAGGQIISNVPGYMKVHLLDRRDLGKRPPAVLTWLGVVEKPPAKPRVLAVMELNLVHKPTPMRKLISITMRLAPGPEDDVTGRWKGYCDRMFCELRGYLMGAG